MALTVQKIAFWDVTTHSLGDRSWEQEMELAHSSVMLLPKYQIIQRHLPENSNHHTLFCITEGHISGQKNQLILQILNAHMVYFKLSKFFLSYCPIGSLDISSVQCLGYRLDDIQFSYNL
jgi:hypothetical protein